MDIYGIFIHRPFLALVPAALFGLFYWQSRRLVVLIAMLAWIAYFIYEQAMKLRILCTGDCNIRVDILLYYPILILLSVLAIVVYVITKRSPKA